MGNKRVAIVFQKNRWENRVVAKRIQYSPSGRSIAIPVRTRNRTEICIIGVYFKHSPEHNIQETTVEWDWVQQVQEQCNLRNVHTIIGGDFNTYGENELDRSSDANRTNASTSMGIRFANWIDNMNTMSSFRIRHPQKQRYTYERNQSKTTLDWQKKNVLVLSRFL